MNSSKAKLFIENILIYGLGGIISKVIPLIMVPIITRLMPNTSYYGLSDLANTVVSFGSSFAVMGMYDAMYRMFFEKEEKAYKKKVCSTAFTFTLFTSGVVFLLMVFFKDIIAHYFLGSRKYAFLIYISAMATLIGATNSIIAAPTRMQNKRKIFLVTNTVSPLLSYCISIPMLLNGHYIIALPLAGLITSITLEISFGILNYSWFRIKDFDFDLLKQLLVIAVPLLPNFLIYWIFNSCDKVMITNVLGISSAGIYSASSKLGHCSQLIYTAFAGGWQFFAFSTMKENDQVESNSKIFEYLGIISFTATAFVCAWSYMIFKIVFTQEYMSGFISAPYLFMAPLLQMLFQVSCNQFLVIKKTWPNMLILSAGAVVNVILNFYLIPIVGIEGASVATLFGYLVSDVICVVVLVRIDLMKVSKRFLVATIVMIIYFILWRMFFTVHWLSGTMLAMGVSICYGMMYRKDLTALITNLKKKK